MDSERLIEMDFLLDALETLLISLDIAADCPWFPLRVRVAGHASGHWRAAALSPHNTASH